MIGEVGVGRAGRALPVSHRLLASCRSALVMCQVPAVDPVVHVADVLQVRFTAQEQRLQILDAGYVRRSRAANSLPATVAPRGRYGADGVHSGIRDERTACQRAGARRLRLTRPRRIDGWLDDALHRHLGSRCRGSGVPIWAHLGGLRLPPALLLEIQADAIVS